MKLNLGAGAPAYHLPVANGWQNVDQDPGLQPQIVATVPPLAWAETGTVAEIYCGHLLEHLTPGLGLALLRECRRVLVPGGRLGVVVPDTRAIMERYLAADPATASGPDGTVYRVADLDDVCAYWLFSRYQSSPHVWAYDEVTLVRALLAAGFGRLAPIDRYHDQRLANPAWDSLGVDAYAPD